MTLLKKIGDHDWLRGSLEAATTLIEYGDFECPFCGRAFRELKRLEATLRDRVVLAFRHFPITQLHPRALLAAEAAEAAGAQGMFWEMHDLMFEHQSDLGPHALLRYAERLGLDLWRFSDELRDHRHLPKVRRDFMEGVRSGVNGTPTFFVNGFRYQESFTAEGLLAAIDGGAQLSI